MRMRSVSAWCTAAVVASVATAIGCTPSGTGGAPNGESPQNAQASGESPQNAPGEAQNPQANPEHGVESMGPPVVLQLEGPATPPEGGTFTLTADLAAPNPIRIPVTVMVTLPPGATLASGQGRELLASLDAGHTRRSFQIQLAAPLTQPIIVTADARAPNQSFGFHAEKKYPAPTTASAPPAQTMPGGPPGSRVPANVPMLKPAGH